MRKFSRTRVDLLVPLAGINNEHGQQEKIWREMFDGETFGLSSEHKTRIFTAILEMLRWFAGHQIRNVAVS